MGRVGVRGVQGGRVARRRLSAEGVVGRRIVEDGVPIAVRRAKARISSGCDSCPDNWSLPPGPDPTVVSRTAIGRLTERLLTFRRSADPIEFVETPQTPTVGRATLDKRRLL